LYGGLSAVALTDVIQVIFWCWYDVFALTPFLMALECGRNGDGNAAPDRFVMILDESNPEYMNLPRIGVLVGGLANIYYWGFNQYIIQRTLAAKSLREAQKESC
jgi:SSS family solute:Na+ symporter